MSAAKKQNPDPGCDRDSIIEATNDMRVRLGDALLAGKSDLAAKLEVEIVQNDSTLDRMDLLADARARAEKAASEAEAQKQRAADVAALNAHLDAADKEIREFVEAVNGLAAPAEAARLHLRDAEALHRRLRAPRLDWQGQEVEYRGVEPIWPWGMAEALVAGRAGAAYGQRRAASGADQAEAALLALCNRCRIAE